jgi:hypothetical protein
MILLEDQHGTGLAIAVESQCVAGYPEPVVCITKAHYDDSGDEDGKGEVIIDLTAEQAHVLCRYLIAWLDSDGVRESLQVTP